MVGFGPLASAPVAALGGSRTYLTLSASTAPVASASRSAGRILAATMPRLGNILTYSNDFTQAGQWFASTTGLVTGKADAHGGNAATTLVPDTSNALHRLQISPNFPAKAVGDQMSVTLETFADGYSYIGVQIAGNGAVFDLSGGTVALGNPLTTAEVIPTITPIAGQAGWYVVTITVRFLAVFNSPQFRVFAQPTAASLGPTFAGDGTSGVRITRIMVNDGLPQPYEATSGTATTRGPATLVKRAGLVLVATTAPAASIARLVGLIRLASATAIATLRQGRTFTASTAPVAQVTRSATRAALAASAPVARVTRQIGLPRNASANVVASSSRFPTKVLVASVAVIGTMQRAVAMTCSIAIMVSATLLALTRAAITSMVRQITLTETGADVTTFQDSGSSAIGVDDGDNRLDL